jgi:hypothetical protein
MPCNASYTRFIFGRFSYVLQIVCIFLYALLCGQNFILVKSGCYSRIAPTRVFIELRTLGEGPRGHEAPPHAVVFELVPDEVRVVWAGFLKETLEVVHRWPRLMLVTVRGG